MQTRHARRYYYQQACQRMHWARRLNNIGHWASEQRADDEQQKGRVVHNTAKGRTNDGARNASRPLGRHRLAFLAHLVFNELCRPPFSCLQRACCGFSRRRFATKVNKEVYAA